MEAEARQQKPPGADTSHPDREYRATGKKAGGGGRQAVAWHQAQQWKLRLQNSVVFRIESDGCQILMQLQQQPAQPRTAPHFLSAWL